MLQPLRTAISFAILAGALWAAFTVDLGGRTFAEHIDTISGTPEAEQLLEGTRSTINPALQEVRDRLLGEYVEAPTWIPEANDAAKPPARKADRRQPDSSGDDQTVPASTLTSDGFEPTLPGRSKPKPKPKPQTPTDDATEPPLPGHRRSSSR